MALPKATDTPRGRHLLAIVQAEPNDILDKWPWPEAWDLKLFGGFIHYYSLVDFALYRVIDILADARLLSAKLPKRTSQLSIGEIQQAILNSKWGRANKTKLENLIEYRGTRNLLAHFVVRRFPKEDAFVFLTRSLRDFKQEVETNLDPSLERLMLFVIDAQDIADRLKEVHDLLNWLVRATEEIDSDLKAKSVSKS